LTNQFTATPRRRGHYILLEEILQPLPRLPSPALNLQVPLILP